MSSEDILNLRKEIQSLAINIQEMYFNNRSDKNKKAKYLLIANLFQRLLKLNTEEEINTFLTTIIAEYSTVRSEYDIKFGEFKTSNNNALIPDVNILGHKVNTYSQVINIIKGSLKNAKNKKDDKIEETTPEEKPIEVKKEEKPAVPKKEVKPVVEPKKEEKPPVKKEAKTKREIKPEELLSSITKQSNKIIELSNRLKKLDENTTEAKSISKELYDLKLQRETDIYQYSSSSYIRQIGELESIEQRLVNSKTKPFNDYDVDANGYIQELKTTINAINEFYFFEHLKSPQYYYYDCGITDGMNQYKIREKLIFYLNKFNSLIYSLFGTRKLTLVVNGEKVPIKDFLSCLMVCNLTGGYETYKATFGKESLVRKDYEELLSFIKRCINALNSAATKKIGDTKVTIKDASPKYEDMLKERDAKIRELYAEIQYQKAKTGVNNERK